MRDAVLDTFLALNRKIVQSGTMAGCTASIVLLVRGQTYLSRAAHTLFTTKPLLRADVLRLK